MRAVLNCERYFVSDDGAAWYQDDAGQMCRLPEDHSHGVYPTVLVNGRHCALCLLVLSAFAGPAPDGKMCLHADDDTLNSALSNLRWGTAKENVADAVRNDVTYESRLPVKKRMLAAKAERTRRELSALKKPKKLVPKKARVKKPRKNKTRAAWNYHKPRGPKL